METDAALWHAMSRGGGSVGRFQAELRMVDLGIVLTLFCLVF